MTCHLSAAEHWVPPQQPEIALSPLVVVPAAILLKIPRANQLGSIHAMRFARKQVCERPERGALICALKSPIADQKSYSSL